MVERRLTATHRACKLFVFALFWPLFQQSSLIGDIESRQVGAWRLMGRKSIFDGLHFRRRGTEKHCQAAAGRTEVNSPSASRSISAECHNDSHHHISGQFLDSDGNLMYALPFSLVGPSSEVIRSAV